MTARGAAEAADGVLICRAGDWAGADPLRRMFYNVTTTELSVALALTIGAVELLEMLRRAHRMILRRCAACTGPA